MRNNNFDTERYMGSKSQILSFSLASLGFLILIAFDGKADVGPGRSFIELTRFDFFAQYAPEAQLLGGTMLVLGGLVYIAAFVTKNYL